MSEEWKAKEDREWDLEKENGCDVKQSEGGRGKSKSAEKRRGRIGGGEG